MKTDFLSWSVFLVAFLLYSATSSPTLGLVDSGELTAAAHTLGIAHPTGYPLFIVLGKLWLSVGFTAADRAMVLFSCFFSAAALALFYSSAIRLLSATGERTFSLRITAALLTLALGCTATVWQSTNFAEVYALSFFVAALLVRLALELSLIEPGTDSIRLALLIFFAWGVGLGNHLTLVWYAPLLMWTAYRVFQSAARPAQSLLMLGAAAALGTSIYLVLLLRSSLNPPLDWGNPEQFEGLWRHVTAWQYRVWMFGGDWSLIFEQLLSFFRTTVQSLTPGLTFFTLLGLFALLLQSSGVLLALLLSLLAGVFYNLNYDIPDIHSYDLIFYPVMFTFALRGLLLIFEYASGSRMARLLRATTPLLAAALLLWPFYVHRVAANHARDSFARDFARELLNSLPDSAVVIQANWDIQSPVLYLQRVENFRTDVAMLDLNLLQRSWYIEEQSWLHPGLFGPCAPLVDNFLREVEAFERGEPYHGPQIEKAFVLMNNGLIDLARQRRPVYLRDAKLYNHSGVGADFPTLVTGYFTRILPDDGNVAPRFDLMNPQTIYFNEAPSAGELRLRTESSIAMSNAGKTALEFQNIPAAVAAARFAGGFDSREIGLFELNRAITDMKKSVGIP